MPIICLFTHTNLKLDNVRYILYMALFKLLMFENSSFHLTGKNATGIRANGNLRSGFWGSNISSYKRYKKALFLAFEDSSTPCVIEWGQ